MFVYHDFNYVNYILNLSMQEGFELYIKCIDRFNNNDLWDLYLVSASNGYEKSFEDFRKEMTIKSYDINMTNEEKEIENERITKKYSGENIKDLRGFINDRSKNTGIQK